MGFFPTSTTAGAAPLYRSPGTSNTPNEKARERNKAVKSELKTHVRRTREAVLAGDKEAAEKALVLAGKKLDKAVSKGVIHQNQAANRKSAIAKQVAAL
ncbi:30S ribosomal protein S20 [Microbacterium sp.]|uniref:30S ribosomal protein S20 n=1 Tax=Microbacterium sp. TaxID=51671 RepID=UPI002600754F|nr:30S ribosomal protein S20 [Microbacterium sp.]